MTDAPRPLPPALTGLRLPLIGAPMYIVSSPDLVVAQCAAGIVGSFPALNARNADGEPVELDAWIDRITEGIDRHNQRHPDRPAAPFGVNLVLRRNAHLDRQIETLQRRGVRIWITSLGAQAAVNDAAHAAGAVVLHDVINNTFARKAIDKGADGLIAVAAGAGGHAGAQSPLALVAEIRAWFDGPLALSGAIGTGAGLLAAQAMGADLGYAGSAFIATTEANAGADYKQMLVESGAEDVIYTPYFTGIHANYLRKSLLAEGLNPDTLPTDPDSIRAFQSQPGRRAVWRRIWGAGQGVGAIHRVVPVEDLVARLEREYHAAARALDRRLGAARPSMGHAG
jgi:nitronate monooxygenase